jgi:hypothetical protein
VTLHQGRDVACCDSIPTVRHGVAVPASGCDHDVMSFVMTHRERRILNLESVTVGENRPIKTPTLFYLSYRSPGRIPMVLDKNHFRRIIICNSNVSTVHRVAFLFTHVSIAR